MHIICVCDLISKHDLKGRACDLTSYMYFHRSTNHALFPSSIHNSCMQAYTLSMFDRDKYRWQFDIAYRALCIRSVLLLALLAIVITSTFTITFRLCVKTLSIPIIPQERRCVDLFKGSFKVVVLLFCFFLGYSKIISLLHSIQFGNER